MKSIEGIGVMENEGRDQVTRRRHTERIQNKSDGKEEEMVIWIILPHGRCSVNQFQSLLLFQVCWESEAVRGERRVCII
jgi:hypothetical protein